MITIVVGGQFGSCAKGKVVAHLSRKFETALAVRTGGPNAGHTVYPDGEKYVTRQLPSALAVPGVQLAIGAGGMVDVPLLMKEINELESRGVEIRNRLWIDPFAVLVEEDAANLEKEGFRLGERLGSTQTGTGYTQMQRIMRRARCAREAPELEPFIADVAIRANQFHDRGQRVIIEGTQGFGLSMLHGGFYPFCTSRDTSASGFASEVGISPRCVSKIYMVMRTWPIRVGGNSGPLHGETNWKSVQNYAGYDHDVTEMTSVTKKVRRVGCFDWALTRRAILINRPTDLVVACLDYLDVRDLGCVDYESLGVRSKNFINELQTRTGSKVTLAFTGPHQNHLIDMGAE